LRASRVLLVGMKGLGAEIAKNLILAGVKGLTMLDHEQVCLTSCSRDVIVKVDQICHKNSIKFFTGDVFGYHGYTFANLGEHEFVKVVFCPVKEALEVDWRSEKAKAALKRTAPDYFLLQVLLKFRTDKGRDPGSDTQSEDAELLLQNRNDVLDSLGVSPDLLPDDFVRYCFSEMAPVCAVVGGILAQEIVKALSQRDPPHNNFFFFDGMKGSGIVECLGPK
uniref:THIF-type NAD/FAD binding fold domain-containing protein n=1 Tax=Jaculus jaculus TaxID=51337 RepID=A0A8C5KVY1_JACJA